VDVENDSIGVLPASGLLPYFLGRQISAVLSERPKPHIGRIHPLVRIAQDGELLTDVAQSPDEPFSRLARGGRVVNQRQYHHRTLGGGAEEELSHAPRVGL
jgi:hypothetical protein